LVPVEYLRLAAALFLTPPLYFCLGFVVGILTGDGLNMATELGTELAIMISIIVPSDLVLQHIRGARKLDVEFFPRPFCLGRCLSFWPARLVFVLGLLVSFAWCAQIELELMHPGMFGSLWPPPNHIVGPILLAWAVLWFSDCTTRTNDGTAFGAGAFLCLVFVCSRSLYGGFIRG
jgi:hypothetical protein